MGLPCCLMGSGLLAWLRDELGAQGLQGCSSYLMGWNSAGRGAEASFRSAQKHWEMLAGPDRPQWDGLKERPRFLGENLPREQGRVSSGSTEGFGPRIQAGSEPSGRSTILTQAPGYSCAWWQGDLEGVATWGPRQLFCGTPQFCITLWIQRGWNAPA